MLIYRVTFEAFCDLPPHVLVLAQMILELSLPLGLCHPLRDIQECPGCNFCFKLSQPTSPSDSEPGIEDWKLKFTLLL